MSPPNVSPTPHFTLTPATDLSVIFPLFCPHLLLALFLLAFVLVASDLVHDVILTRLLESMTQRAPDLVAVLPERKIRTKSMLRCTEVQNNKESRC